MRKRLSVLGLGRTQVNIAYPEVQERMVTDSSSSSLNISTPARSYTWHASMITTTPTVTHNGSNTYTPDRSTGRVALALVSCSDPASLATKLSRLVRSDIDQVLAADPYARTTATPTGSRSPTCPTVDDHDWRTAYVNHISSTASGWVSWLRGTDVKAQAARRGQELESVKSFLRQPGPGDINADSLRLVLIQHGVSEVQIREAMRRAANDAMHEEGVSQVISLDPSAWDPLSPEMEEGSSERMPSSLQRFQQSVGFMFGQVKGSVKESMHGEQDRATKKVASSVTQWEKGVQTSLDSNEASENRVKLSADDVPPAADQSIAHVWEEDPNWTAEERSAAVQKHLAETAKVRQERWWSSTAFNPSNWAIPTSLDAAKSAASTVWSYISPVGCIDWFREHHLDPNVDHISNATRRKAKRLVDDLVHGEMSWFERGPQRSWSGIKSVACNEETEAGTQQFSYHLRRPTVSSLQATLTEEERQLSLNYDRKIAQEEEKRRRLAEEERKREQERAAERSRREAADAEAVARAAAKQSDDLSKSVQSAGA